MKVILGLLVAGFLLGHVFLDFAAAAVCLINRKRDRLFLCLAILLISIGLLPAVIFVAASGVPQPRSEEFRWSLIAALSLLAVGGWPVSLSLLLPYWSYGHNGLSVEAERAEVSLKRIRILSIVGGAVISAISSSVLIGYVISLPRLIQPFGGAVAMATHTAACLLIAGLLFITWGLAKK